MTNLNSDTSNEDFKLIATITLCSGLTAIITRTRDNNYRVKQMSMTTEYSRRTYASLESALQAVSEQIYEDCHHE